MHAIFYQNPDGSRKARVHFDLHGPGNKYGHISEVIRNRLTFGRTSEYEVFRGLTRLDPGGLRQSPEPRYDVVAHAREYLTKTFGPTAMIKAIASGATSSTIRRLNGGGIGPEQYADRIATNLVRNAAAQSIEFVTAAFLQQDQSFSPSGEHGFGRRTRLALYRSLFVPGREGDELAFPRIAAAVGTPWLMGQWHWSRQNAPEPWVQSAVLFGQYVARSYWAEFKPDIKRTLRRAFRRTD